MDYVLLLGFIEYSRTVDTFLHRNILDSRSPSILSKLGGRRNVEQFVNGLKPRSSPSLRVCLVPFDELPRIELDSFCTHSWGRVDLKNVPVAVSSVKNIDNTKIKSE